jgi:serine/threonine protein kinase
LKIEDFTIIKVIGIGTFGKVKLVKKNDSGEILAMKSIRKQYIIENNNVKHIMAERKILETVPFFFLILDESPFLSKS